MRLHACLAVLLAAAAGLGGCAAGTPAPPDRFLRLSPPAPPALNAPVLDGPVLVKRFTADGVLGQRPLLYSRPGAPGVLQQYNYVYWAESPTVMLQALTVDALRAARVASRVITPQYGADAPYVLVGTLRALEHRQGSAPAVAVAMELGVATRDGQPPLLVGSYDVTEAVDGGGVDAAAAAMGRAVGAILARFVSDLAARPR